MIKPGPSPDTFLIAFAAVPRKRSLLDAARALGTPAGPVRVDGFALGHVVAAALSACDFLGVDGKPLVWNEYALFLARGDHDRLRPLEDTLHIEVLKLLNQRMVEREATAVGPLTVRLLVDDGDGVTQGHAVLRVRHTKDVANIEAVPGEITMRSDRIAPKAVVPPPDPNRTQRDVGLRVESAEGSIVLPEGERVVLGRSDPDAAADHRPIPGAGARINRRHLALTVTGNSVVICREPGSNPVSVAGAPLASGATARATLPVVVTLAGDFDVRVTR